MHFLAKKTGASLSREPQETRQGNLPAPAAPWHPGTALPRTVAKSTPRHGVAKASCLLAFLW